MVNRQPYTVIYRHLSYHMPILCCQPKIPHEVPSTNIIMTASCNKDIRKLCSCLFSWKSMLLLIKMPLSNSIKIIFNYTQLIMNEFNLYSYRNDEMDSSRFRPHLLRTPDFCWCDKEAITAFHKVGKRCIQNYIFVVIIM